MQIAFTTFFGIALAIFTSGIALGKFINKIETFIDEYKNNRRPLK